MKLLKYQTRQIRYSNGVKIKFDNRSVTSFNIDDNGDKIGIELRRFVEPGHQIQPMQEVLKDKILVTQVSITKEAAEAIMYSIAHHLGCEVVEPSHSATPYNRSPGQTKT